MRWHFKQKVIRLSREVEKKDLTLCDEQYNDMLNVSRIVKKDFASVVDEVIKSSSESETERQALKHVWERDCSRRHAKEKAEYQQDQVHNKPSCSGNLLF